MPALQRGNTSGFRVRKVLFTRFWLGTADQTGWRLHSGTGVSQKHARHRFTAGSPYHVLLPFQKDSVLKPVESAGVWANGQQASLIGHLFTLLHRRTPATIHIRIRFASIYRALRVLGLASLAATILGCTTAPTPIAREAANRIRRVAVIAAAAKTFTRQYTGLTVFGNEKEEIDISGWKIDEQYEEQLASEIGKLAGLSVVKAPHSRAEFAHVNDLNGPWNAFSFGEPNWSAIEAATLSYCSANSLDAILVLSKATTHDFLGGSNQFFGGAGIYVRGPGSRISVMHLISKIALLDCRTGKPLATRFVAMNQNSPPGAIVRSAPVISLPAEVSRSPISQWSDQQKKQIQSSLAALPIQTWAITLRSIFPSKVNSR